MDVKSTITAAIGVIVVTIVLLALTPTIVSQVDRIIIDSQGGYPYYNDTSVTWNFTGASGARSILGLVPFIWIAAILLCAIAGMWAIIQKRRE